MWVPPRLSWVTTLYLHNPVFNKYKFHWLLPFALTLFTESSYHFYWLHLIRENLWDWRFLNQAVIKSWTNRKLRACCPFNSRRWHGRAPLVSVLRSVQIQAQYRQCYHHWNLCYLLKIFRCEDFQYVEGTIWLPGRTWWYLLQVRCFVLNLARRLWKSTEWRALVFTLAYKGNIVSKKSDEYGVFSPMNAKNPA